MPDPRIVGPAPTGSKPVYVYDVVGVSPNQELKVLILDDVIRGAMHHWVKDADYPQGRSRLCEWESGECAWHEHRQVWLGYCAAILMPRKQRVVLRVGPETALEILRHLGRRITLRGAHLMLTSRYEGKTARAVVETLHELQLAGPTPVAHSIDHTLLTVLGCKTLPLLWEAQQLTGASMPLTADEGAATEGGAS